MAGIWLKGAVLVGSLSEIAGYKSGLTLSRSELKQILHSEDRFSQCWPESFDSIMRIRSEVFESLVAWVLFKIGNIDSPDTGLFSIRLYHKYAKTGRLDEFTGIFSKFLAYFQEHRVRYAKDSSPENRTIDPVPFVKQMSEMHGAFGELVSLELFDGYIEQLHRSPWGPFREVDWTDSVALRDLFKSEGLETAYGQFFDQRFIDYLYRNFGDIDKINWRKFEGLAGEFFAREGFRVELGPGRGDEGVDLRVWMPDASPNAVPTILIQCKRQKAKISKVVVKALHADVQHESASSGLIVTTSALSPGASQTCAVRSYPIREANRKTLVQWIEKMRTPRTGVFLGE